MTVLEWHPNQLAYCRVDTDAPIDDVREPIAGTEWQFTVSGEPKLLEVSGMFYAEYVAHETSGFDATKPVSLSLMPWVRPVGAEWKGVGFRAFGRNFSGGSNMRDAKQHYGGLPMMAVDVLPPGDYEVALTVRSGNKNLADDAVASLVKDNQNCIKYAVLGRSQTVATSAPVLPAGGTPISPFTLQQLWEALGASLGHTN